MARAVQRTGPRHGGVAEAQQDPGDPRRRRRHLPRIQLPEIQAAQGEGDDEHADRHEPVGDAPGRQKICKIAPGLLLQGPVEPGRVPAGREGDPSRDRGREAGFQEDAEEECALAENEPEPELLGVHGVEQDRQDRGD